jgi:DNA-binding transcriptional regulator YdaS (Cro superfamily)
MSVELKEEMLKLAQGRLGYQMAIEAAGSAAALADSLGVSRAVVSLWKWRGIPPGHCLKIHRITNVPLHQLRPDIYPAPSPCEA